MSLKEKEAEHLYLLHSNTFMLIHLGQLSLKRNQMRKRAGQSAIVIFKNRVVQIAQKIHCTPQD